METHKQYWLDDRRNVNKIFWGLCIVCGLFILPDLFVHKHGHFRWENWTGFYGLYGFVACVGLVLLAKQFRKVLKRPEEYYE